VANVASPELRVFPAQQPNGQAVLVIPGGGYQFVSVENEGADFAARLNARGYTVFVLVYRLPSEGWQRGEDVPLQDAQRAMRVIRANAARWKIDARTLAVVGFSAGGHLAATLSTGFAEPVYVPVDGADAASPRPFAAALIYPVITMALPGTHPTSRELAARPESAALTGRAALRRTPCRRGDAAAPHRACDRRHGGAGLEQSEPAHGNACRGPAGRSAFLPGRRPRVRVGVSELPDIVVDRCLRRMARSTPG
jgi:acetyl esterase/lipase